MSLVYVYVISSKQNGKKYTGITSDMDRRIRQHNNGSVSSTKGKGPWFLVYFEYFDSYTKARIREKYLKSGWERKWLKSKLGRKVIS